MHSKNLLIIGNKTVLTSEVVEEVVAFEPFRRDFQSQSLLSMLSAISFLTVSTVPLTGKTTVSMYVNMTS